MLLTIIKQAAALQLKTTIYVSQSLEGTIDLVSNRKAFNEIT